MTAVRLNQTQVVLLGFLRGRPRTGYEIKALVDRTVRFFWNASVSGIYPELKRLEEAGLLRSEEDGRRTTYAMTDAGREALHDWLTADVTPSYELRHEGMLKLFFADGLAEDEQLELVRRMREAHEAKTAQLQALRPDAERAGGWTAAMRDFGEGWNAWAIEWCRRTEERLTAREGSAGTR